MKKIVRLTESDLTRIVKRVLMEEKNYFKVIDGDGDLVWMGTTDKGSEEERELINKLFDNGYRLIPSTKEKFEYFDFEENVLMYIFSLFDSMNYEDDIFDDEDYVNEGDAIDFYTEEGENVYSYYFPIFFIKEDIFSKVSEKFDLDVNETLQMFYQYFNLRYPNLPFKFINLK